MEKVLKSFKKNKLGKDYICGDIHGNKDELMLCLKEINFDFKADRLFCCGDITDRGNDDFGSMSLVYEPWFYFVLGNHENMIASRFFYNAEGNGTYWALTISENPSLYPEEYKTLSSYIDFIKKAPLCIELETDNGLIGISHSYTDDSWYDVLEQAKFDYERIHRNGYKCVECLTLWDRNINIPEYQDYLKNNPIDGVDYIFHGHTIMYNGKKTMPKAFSNHVYIDTGFFLGNWKSSLFKGNLTIYDVSNELFNVFTVDFRVKEVYNNILKFSDILQ